MMTEIDRTNETNGKPAAMLLVQLSFARLGTRRKGDLDEIQTDADKDKLGLSKRVLLCPEFKAIRTHDRETVEWLKQRSIPALFKAGIYHISPEAALVIDEYLRARADERVALVQRFVEIYPKVREADRVQLGPQFRELDYPDPLDVPRRFAVNWRFFTLGAPGELAKFSPQIFEREKDRIVGLMEEARQEGVALLRAGFKELVDHMVSALTPDEDGKRKRFYRSSVDNLIEFLDTFPLRNLGDDAELGALLAKTRKLLSGEAAAVVKSIKDSDTIRDGMRAGFERLQAQLDPLVVAAPSRRFDPAGYESDG